MKFENRVVVVTGSSRGLGASISQTLVESGFRVVGIARNEAPDDLEKLHPLYQHLKWDLSVTDSLKELVDKIQVEFGWPYALVNNAAIGSDGLLPTMHNSDIERLLRVNLTAPIILTKYLVRGMISQRRGRVVNIGSIVAKSGYRGLAVYGATKAGLEGFTRSLSRDLGGRNVTVNAVAPGFLATEMTASLGSEDLDKVMRRSAMNRFATVNEVASAVLYLLSEEAGGITGTVLTVDAGSTA